MIDLRRLQVLRAVAHYGTVTAAAQALHFTPSAASQQLRQLAKELDVELLEPRGRRVQLTQAARNLLTHADAIAARWERAEAELRTDHDEPTGLLRMCGFPVAVSTLLAPVAATMRTRYPELRVRVEQTEQRDSFDLLFDGDVDLAIVEATPDNPMSRDTRFDQRALLDDRFDLVVPAGHPFAGRTAIALADAADEDWVVGGTESTCRAHSITACSAAGFSPRTAHHATEWSAVASLVGHRLGVALIPRLAQLPPDPPVERVPLLGDPSPRRKLLTCTRAGGEQHPATAAALRELRLAARGAVA